MKHKVQLKLLHAVCILIIGSITYGTTCAVESRLNFDDVLAITPYAVLLKELICLTDVIGLLRHSKKEDEHRFIEDSVLGKMVRAKGLVSHINFDQTLQEDIEYLYYWLKVAASEPLSQLLQEQMAELKRTLHAHVHKGLQADEIS